MSVLLAVQDPGCEMLGWRHPMCAGGAFEQPVDDGVPGDNAAEGGLPAPAMVPNIDGSLSPPGTTGAISAQRDASRILIAKMSVSPGWMPALG
jgi:hypothetical protein